MNNKSTSPIAKGRFGRRWMIIIIIGGIGLLCVIAGISFLFQGPEAAEIAHYPILSGLVFLLPCVGIFLMQGRIWLDDSGLHFKRRVSKQTDIPLDQVDRQMVGGGVPALNYTLHLKNKRSYSFGDMGPSRVPGAIWAYLAYRNDIPERLLRNLSAKKTENSAKSLGQASRTFVTNGKNGVEDLGVYVKLGEKIYYVPSTTTQSPGNMMGLVSPISFSRYLKTPNVPERELLPIQSTVFNIMNSGGSDGEKENWLLFLVNLHNGSIVHQDQRNSKGQLYETVDKELQLVLRGGGL